MSHIDITRNERNRTVTIRIKEGRNTISKYRTYKLSKIEFHNCWYWTEFDWRSFLKWGSYHVLK